MKTSQMKVAMMFIATTLMTAGAHAQTVNIPLTPEECALISMGCAPSSESVTTETAADEMATVVEQDAPIAVVPPNVEPSTGSVVRRKEEQKEKRWTRRGGDPCNPKAGCTLEASLAKTHEESGWPEEVTDALMNAVKNGAPERTEICHGWRGWMTWGRWSFKFHPNTVAHWGEGECESADAWYFDHKAASPSPLRYVLVRVDVCGNWGGWTEAVTIVPAPEPMVVSEDEPPLGVLPITYCP